MGKAATKHDKPDYVDYLILHQFDAARTSPGGIDTIIRGILKYTSQSVTLAVVGVDTTPGSTSQRLGRWEQHQIGSRTVHFLPVAHLDPANQNRRIPHTLQLTAGLMRFRHHLPKAGTVQCHRMDTALVTRLLIPRPLMYFIHTQVGGSTGRESDSFWRFLGDIHPRLERFVTRHATAVWAFSPERIEQIREWNSSAQMTPTWWDPAQLTAAVSAQPVRDPHRILWVGRIEKLKDPALAVAAMSQLVQTDPSIPWSLHFYGPGTQIDHLRHTISQQDSGVASRIHVHGRVEPEEITRQQAASGVFLMTSFPGYEGFPTVIVESLATGLPVVVTQGADPGHLVVDGVNGFVTGRDPAEVAQKIGQASALDHARIPPTVAQLSAPTVVGKIMGRNPIAAPAAAHPGCDATKPPSPDTWVSGPVMRRSQSGITLNDLPLQTGTLPAVTQDIDHLRQQEDPQLVVTANVDQLVHLKQSNVLRRAYMAAGLRLIDGMPLVWVAKALGEREANRHTGADLLPTYARLSAERGLRLVITGGADQIVERAARNLTIANPGANIQTVPFPFLDSTQDPRSSQVIKELHKLEPDIVFLCLGSPKQEEWFLTWRDELPMAVYIGAGAAVDFAAGARRRAPLFIQKASLEWVWRLGQEPRRLAGRYLLDGPKFLSVVFRSLARR